MRTLQTALLCCLLAHVAAGVLAADQDWKTQTEQTRRAMLWMEKLPRRDDASNALKEYLRAFQPDVVVHGLVPGAVGLAEVTAHYTEVFHNLPGVLVVDDRVVAGPMAAHRYHSLMRLTGEFDGVQANNKLVAIRGVTFFHFGAGGRIAERWSNHDHGYRMGQLLGPRGREAGDRLAAELNGPGLSEQEVQVRLEQLIDALNLIHVPTERSEGFFALFAPEATIHGIAAGPASLQQFRQYLDELWQALPDLIWAGSRPMSAWSMGAMQLKATGSLRAPYRGREASNSPVGLSGDWIMRFDRGGRVTEAWISMNSPDWGIARVPD